MKPMCRIAGFSLVEVMCAILILGIGLVGLTQGLSTALVSNKEAELQTQAAQLAAGQIELLRAEPYLTAGSQEGEGEEGLAQFRWKQSVTATSIDGLYEVEVAVENARSGKIIYELKTMLFDPPVYTSPDEREDRREATRGRKREGRPR